MVSGVKSFFLNSRGLHKVPRPIKNNDNSGSLHLLIAFVGKEKGLEISSFKVKSEYNDYIYSVTTVIITKYSSG